MSEILTKADFYKAAMDELEKYPTLAARIAAGDVQITQQIGAISQMLAMLSAQIGMAEVEPWIKARDNMVLADASAKGILPKAKAPIYKAIVINHGNKSVKVTEGRRLLDNKGRTWFISKGVEVQPEQQAEVQITQCDTITTNHVVSEQKSFYKIKLPSLEQNQYLVDIAVQHQEGTFFYCAERFNNIDINERCYHLLSDELMNIYIQFGVQGKIGYVPSLGESIKIILKYTYGDVFLPEATALDFEYAQEDDSFLEIVSSNNIEAGTLPSSIDELREMTDFPYIYNENAVFLGEFSLLLLRKLSPFVFLNVWNEKIEESVRGANVDNINTLFVSFKKDNVDEEPIKEIIRQIINQADSSYKIKFVVPVERKIQVHIRLFLASMHDDSLVKNKIISLLIEWYGRNSIFARKGMVRINWMKTISNLKDNIIELQDGVSDISLSVDDMDDLKPENFCFVDAETISITSSKLI